MKLSVAEFRKLVDEALQDVPEGFGPYLSGLAVDVERLADRRTLEAVGLADPYALLGLYEGTPLTERSVTQPVQYPERIVIFQESIQRMCRNRRQIVRQIRKTVLHEIGHHFGLDESDLEELGYE